MFNNGLFFIYKSMHLLCYSLKQTLRTLSLHHQGVALPMLII